MSKKKSWRRVQMSEKGDDGEKVGGEGRGMSEWVMVVSLSGGDEQPLDGERCCQSENGRRVCVCMHI